MRRRRRRRSLLAAAAVGACAAAAAGGSHICWAELHPRLLAKDVQLSGYPAALRLHHLAAKVGKAAAHHSNLMDSGLGKGRGGSG